MTIRIRTTPELGFLPFADGSASFTQATTTVFASVNGPMEVKPRDELPQEAFIEVIVRPAIGVAGTRERYLESRLLSALKPVVLRTQHPRSLIQIVIQVVQSAHHASSVWLLAPCLNVAVLALLDAAVPLKTVLTATTLVLGDDGKVVTDGSRGTSTHVFAFTSAGELSFVESEGKFLFEEWEEAVDRAKIECELLPPEAKIDDAKEEKKEASVGMEIDDAKEEKTEVGVGMEIDDAKEEKTEVGVGMEVDDAKEEEKEAEEMGVDDAKEKKKEETVGQLVRKTIEEKIAKDLNWRNLR